MLTGPDCSSYQGQVDWGKVAAAGHSFAACKATEGRSYLDPTFARNWSGIKAAGLTRVAYHFAHPDRNTPDVEAAWFLSHVHLEAGDLVMLDYETAPYQLGWARTFAARVAVPTVLYYPASQAAAFNGWTGERWPASYGRQPSKPWRFWQYTDRATVPGVPGACDCSYFDGTIAELHALAGGVGPVTPPTKQEANHMIDGTAIAIEATPTGAGYYICSDTGAVYAYGDAHYQGGGNTYQHPRPFTDMAVCQGGYWLVEQDGAVYSFGAAKYLGAPNA